MCGHGILPGGCYPSQPTYRPWGYRPHRVPVKTHHGNLDNATVGQRCGFWGPKDVKGFGLDLNRNGCYERGRDGVLAFDFNRNGKIGKGEVEKSREMLRAFGGNNDLNGDGKTTFCEKIKAKKLRCRMQQYDTNRNGRLEAHEIDRAGGRVLIDHNRDGKFQGHESYSPYSFPTPGFGRGRLDFVDPARNHTQVHRGWQWSYPPCRCC